MTDRALQAVKGSFKVTYNVESAILTVKGVSMDSSIAAVIAIESSAQILEEFRAVAQGKLHRQEAELEVDLRKAEVQYSKARSAFEVFAASNRIISTAEKQVQYDRLNSRLIEAEGRYNMIRGEMLANRDASRRAEPDVLIINVPRKYGVRTGVSAYSLLGFGFALAGAITLTLVLLKYKTD
jgi:hypothetical protein